VRPVRPVPPPASVARQPVPRAPQPVYQVPPVIPVARPAPVPLPVPVPYARAAPMQLPPRRSPAGWLMKGIFLLFFVGASVAAGAFLLPGMTRGKGKADQGKTPSTATRDERPADPTKEPGTPAPTTRVADSFAPDPSVLARPGYTPPVTARPAASSVAQRLARRIDAELDRALAAGGIPVSPVADDAEFLRRAHLDLTGKIPTAEQAASFLDDTDPGKRSKLIEILIENGEYGRNLARVWRDLLIKRDLDNNRGLKTEAFTSWLADQFNRNEKWDRTVTAMLTAEGKEEASPATLFFMANQDNNQPNPAKLVGAVGNLFMGIHIQCAECHVHPYTSKWKQEDFWGMAAFFGKVRADRGGGKNKKRGPATIVEAAANGRGKKKGGPAGAVIAIPDPTNPRRTIKTVRAKFFEGEQPTLSKGPYRQHLAQWLTGSENPYFSRALVNRMWAHFFARGLVNPLDDMNPDNEPSHPELLQMLTDEFNRSGHDVKFLVRAIAGTQAYQRTSRPLPGNVEDEKLLSHMPVKVLDAEVMLGALATASGQRPGRAPAGRGGKRGNNGGLLGFFDTREYNDDPTEFSSGVPQVLKLMNTGLTSNGGPVVSRLMRSTKEPARVIEGLFLTALARRPSAAESERMLRYVNKQSDPARGYGGVLWALLNSAEFANNR
jgi:Protein of unknown function (DUF1549)/Protein of unknown function (DUF1553)